MEGRDGKGDEGSGVGGGRRSGRRGEGLGEDRRGCGRELWGVEWSEMEGETGGEMRGWRGLEGRGVVCRGED